MHRRRNGGSSDPHRRQILLVLPVLWAALLAVALPAAARADAARVDADATLIGPVKPFTLVVLGDSLADGLWGGLFRTLQKDNRVDVVRRGRNGTGLARPERYDWRQGLEEVLATDKPDAALIVFGLNDRQDMLNENRRRIAIRGEEWTRVYGERVAAIIERLKKDKVIVYWAGLPIMRDKDINRDVQYLNEIYKSVAEKSGAHFLPLWTISADENGEYATYGRDAEGRMHQYRAEDGMHFTSVGYDRLIRRLLPRISPDIDAVWTARTVGAPLEKRNGQGSPDHAVLLAPVGPTMAGMEVRP